MSFPNSLRLPLRFDAEALARDAAGCERWDAHFNAGTYDGDWSGVPLRSKGGAVALLADPEAPGAFAETGALARCPNVRDALARFRCELHAVRFLRLGAGAEIREHRDYGLGLEESGEARIHIPVVTGPGVEFVLADAVIEMQPGECWYLNVNRHHAVYNGSDRARIHLVVDAVANEWLYGLLNAAEATRGTR